MAMLPAVMASAALVGLVAWCLWSELRGEDESW